MDKAIAICLTALLLLAGCLDAEDAEDKIEIVGCGDEDALNYNEEATETQDDLCSSEEELEEAIVEFINFMDEGPDIETLDTTIGFSMEVSEVYTNTDECEDWEYWNPDLVDESQPYNGCPSVSEEVWYFMETVLVSPDGLKSSIEDRYGGSFSTEEVIYYGNQIQYSMTGTDDEGNDQSMQFRMSHSGTFESIYNMDNDDEDMDDDMGDEMVCHDMSTHTNDYSIDNEEDCEDSGGIWITDDDGNNGHGNDEDGHDESNPGNSHGNDDDMDDEEDENPESDDYTGIFDPVSATFSGFEVTDSGMTFSGMLNVEDAPFGAMNVYTNSDMEITGFDLMDVENEDNWVKFQLLNSGDISIDESIEQHALPFMLMDMTELEDDDDHDHGHDEMVCYDIDTHTIVDIHDEDDCWDAGYMWTSMDRDDDGHGHDDEEMVCYDIDTHTIVDIDDEDDCWDAGYMWTSMDRDDDDHDNSHYDTPTFICGDGTEIPFEYVNDGDADCDDGADEQQFDTDGNEINWFDCMDGSKVWISQVNDGTDDCPDGEDEVHDEDHTETYYYDNCEEGDGLSSYDCWTNEMDVDGDGNPEDSDSYWNYECEQHGDGTWECMTDYVNYYDNCVDDSHDSDLECWLDEWDTDNDGFYDLGSDGYMNYECEQLADGRWACGHTDVIELFQNYDNCDEESSMYECWNDDWADSDGNVAITDDYELGDCSQLENGTWDCFVGYVFDDDDHDEDRDDMEDLYYRCIPFVPYSTEGFSDFDDSNLDDSKCGEMIIDSDFDIEDTGIFTMPEHIIFQDCWMEDDETVCHEAEITYNSDSGELWETYSEEEYMDCDGDYDNDTGLCVNWVGNVTASNATAFIIDDGEVEILLHYQYDSELMSGYLIVPTEPESEDLSATFDMIDADGDGEVTLSEWIDAANESDDGPMSDEEIEQLSMMINVCDGDDSGGLNYTEFVSLNESCRGDDDDPEFIFLMIDTDEDGEVTLTEWVEAANSGDDPMSDEDIEGLSMMMNMYDDDNSGGLDLDEFINMMEEMDNHDDDHDSPMQVLVVVGMEGGIGGSLDDYSLTLANCEDLDEDENLNDLDCSADIWSMKLSDILVDEDEIMTSGLSIMYMDSDSSNSLTTGDVIMIDHSTLDVDEDWNTARLHSEEADSYADENPMLPGFTGIIATIGLLGAALLRRD